MFFFFFVSRNYMFLNLGYVSVMHIIMHVGGLESVGTPPVATWMYMVGPRLTLRLRVLFFF